MKITIGAYEFTEFDFNSEKAIVENNPVTRYFLVINEESFTFYETLDITNKITIQYTDNNLNQISLENLDVIVAVYDFTQPVLRLHFE